MQICIFVILTVFGPQTLVVNAQQVITIGTGTSSIYTLPVRCSRKYGWTAVIYPQSLMQNTTGVITSLAYKITNTVGCGSPMLNQKIYLKTITNTSFINTSYISPTQIGADLVYDGNISWNGPGWNTIVLDNSFMYTGGNLLILIEDHSGVQYCSSPLFQATYLSTPHRAKGNNYYASFPAISGYYVDYYPNIKIAFAPFDSNNIALKSWISPIGNILPNSSQPMKVCIRNLGTVTQDSMTIIYSIDNGTTYVTETILDSITAFDTLIYTFNTNANLSKMKHYHGISIVKNQGDTIADDDSLNFDFWVGHALSGTYSVGSNPTNDFQTLSDAIDVLENFGATSSVTFKLDSQNFNEQIAIHGPIIGLSGTNTLTIKGNGINSKIIASPNVSNNSIFSLQNINRVILDSISIVSISNVGNYSGLSISSSDSVIVKNCHISLPINNSPNTNCVVAGYCISFSFENNETEGGNTSLYIGGNTSNAKFINNEIHDYHYRGLYAINQSNAIYQNNDFRSQKSTTPLYCVSLLNHINRTVFSTNKIICNTTSSAHALDIINCTGNSDSNAFIVSNNMISVLRGNYGIFINSGKYMHIYNNSVRMGSICNSNSKAIIIQNSASSSNFTNNRIKNNIFANYGSGYVISMLGGAFYPSNIVEFDYNNLYSKSIKFVATNSYSNLYSNLAAWQASASGLAVHSISMDPIFYSPTNLHSRSINMNDSGAYIYQVPFDFDNDIRDTILPDIGADEYTPFTTDLAIVEWYTPLTGVSLSNSIQVKVRVANLGTQTQSNIPIKYSIDGGISYSYDTVPGPLTTFDTILFTFSTTTSMNTFGYRECIAIIDHTSDQYRDNDTIHYNMFSCNPMSGLYTLGTNVNNDFHSFAKLKYALESCGLSGPVVINIDSGIYDENIVFEAIAGASQTNTITLRGEGTNKTKITNSNADNNNRYIFRFDGAKYFVLDSLSIIRDSAVDFFWGVHFIHQANNNTIKNCLIDCGMGNSNSIIGILASGSIASHSAQGNNANYCSIENNVIIGGYYGIYFTASLTYANIYNKFNNNILRNQHASSLVNYYQKNTEINSNIIKSGSQTSYSATAIHIYNAENSTIINSNKIDFEGKYGLRLENCWHSSSSTMFLTVKNNFILVHHNTQNTNLTTYGIYIYSTTYARIYNNTVKLDGLSTNNGNALLIYGTQGLQIKNNILDNELNGPVIGSEYSVNLNTLFNDYNNLISASGIYAFMNSNNYSSLQSWKQYSNASHSVSINPDFYSNTDLHVNSLTMSNLGINISGVTHDIDGDNRNSFQPDIGADEYSHITISIGGNKTICEGDSVIVNAYTNVSNNNLNFLWTLNGDTLSSTNSSVVVDTAGILIVGVDSSSIKDTISITLIPLPVVYLGTDTIIKKSNGGIVLDAGNPNASWLWSNGGTTQTQLFSYFNLTLGMNNIWVNVTENNCTASDTIILNYFNDVSIIEISKSNTISLYPNPNSGNFYLKTGDLDDNLQIMIIDINGKIIYDKEFLSTAKSVIHIDLNDIAKGIYTIKITTKNEIKVGSLIIN